MAFLLDNLTELNAVGPLFMGRLDLDRIGVEGGSYRGMVESPGGRGPTLAYDACRVWFFDTCLKGESPPFPTNKEIYGGLRK